MVVLFVDGNDIVLTGVVDVVKVKPLLDGGVELPVFVTVEVGSVIVFTGIAEPIVPTPLVEGVVVTPIVGAGVIGATILGIIELIVV